MGTAGWPALIKPMLAVPGELPPGPGWAYEAKWDGVRAVAYINKAGKLKLLSRNDLDVTRPTPRLKCWDRWYLAKRPSWTASW